MNPPPQFACSRLAFRLKCVLAPALLLGCGLMVQLGAQESCRESCKAAPQPAALPTAPQAAHAPADPIHFVPPADSSQLWSRAVPDPLQPRLDAFQPSPNFSIFSGPSNSGDRSSGDGAGFAAGSGSERRTSLDFNAINSPAFGRFQTGPAPLFPAGHFPPAHFPSGQMSSPFSMPPSALPSLNQMMRGSFNFPLNNTANTFKLSYQDASADLFRPSTALLFTSTDLGNGMFFSAGTSLGRSMAGTPAASLGGNASPGSKHSGPALGLKLSF